MCAIVDEINCLVVYTVFYCAFSVNNAIIQPL